MKLLYRYLDNALEHLLPIGEFRIFSDIGGGFSLSDGVDLSELDDSLKAGVIAQAEAWMDEEYPILLAHDFARYHREGNRAIFEEVYFKRRHLLTAFSLAEAIEGKGRFLDRIMDGIWLICEETDWVIPAHVRDTKPGPLPPSFAGDFKYFDLFSAGTAGVLAMVYLLVRKQLDEITPHISNRIAFCVKERILKPFLAYDMPNWMGIGRPGRGVNNWNPWILSNVLTCAAVFEEDIVKRRQIVAYSMICLDNFISVYHSDGGCDEGPSYWGEAGAALFDALELLYDMTGGYVDLFGEELIRRMGDYEADFHVGGRYFINFADCPAKISPGGRLITRYGRRTGSQYLENFGRYMQKNQTYGASDHANGYRWLKNAFEKTAEAVEFQPKTQCWYDGIGVMKEREFSEEARGFVLACKGGHNNESHNHNDVGNFIVYYNG
ncbi:MAG: hypothetical protein E7632_09590, partial [Ruminococcaceae bacterium]|nr:hypothetical protein [Oscillospiraceae bacterium]